MELTTEFVFVENLFEVFGNEFWLELEHTTTECA